MAMLARASQEIVDATNVLFLHFWRKKDPQIKNMIVKLNLSLVNMVTRNFTKYIGPSLGLDDFRQIGSIGLMNAVSKFPVGEDVAKFPAFASTYIRRIITRGIREKGATVKKPHRIHDLHHRVNSSLQRLIHTFARKPTPNEIASDVNFSIEEVNHHLARLNQRTLSLNGGEGMLEGDYHRDEQTITSLTHLMSLEELVTVKAKLVRLFGLLELAPVKERGRLAFRLRYGLSGEPPKSLSKVGQALGCMGRPVSEDGARTLILRVWEKIQIFDYSYSESFLTTELKRLKLMFSCLGSDEDPTSWQPEQFGFEEEIRLLMLLPPNRKSGPQIGQDTPQAKRLFEYRLKQAQTIVMAVEESYGLPQGEVASLSKGKKVCRARRVSTYLIVNDLGQTFFLAAKAIGKRMSHWIIDGYNSVDRSIQENQILRDEVEAIRQKL